MWAMIIDGEINRSVWWSAGWSVKILSLFWLFLEIFEVCFTFHCSRRVNQKSFTTPAIWCSFFWFLHTILRWQTLASVDLSFGRFQFCFVTVDAILWQFHAFAAVQLRFEHRNTFKTNANREWDVRDQSFGLASGHQFCPSSATNKSKCHRTNANSGFFASLKPLAC